MIALKLSRFLTGDPNYVDHMLDISGYAMLLVAKASRTLVKFADNLTHTGTIELARRIETFWRQHGSSQISCEVLPISSGMS